MIHIEFTEEQINELRHERYSHPHPRVQRKMEALFLKSQGLTLHRTFHFRCANTFENRKFRPLFFSSKCAENVPYLPFFSAQKFARGHKVRHLNEYIISD